MMTAYCRHINDLTERAVGGDDRAFVEIVKELFALIMQSEDPEHALTFQEYVSRRERVIRRFLELLSGYVEESALRRFIDNECNRENYH